MVNTKIRLIIFFAAKDGEAPYSQQKQNLEADFGSDHELLIEKFRLKLKKVGKTTRPFWYDLNQIKIIIFFSYCRQVLMEKDVATTNPGVYVAMWKRLLLEFLSLPSKYFKKKLIHPLQVKCSKLI